MSLGNRPLFIWFGYVGDPVSLLAPPVPGFPLELYEKGIKGHYLYPVLMFVVEFTGLVYSFQHSLDKAGSWCLVVKVLIQKPCCII